MAKYLGVNIRVRGCTVLKDYQAVLVRRALRYAYSIMSLTRRGLDRALVARKIWEICAIPVTLYCSEVGVFRFSTLEELKCIQNMVGWFILQVPVCTSQALAWMDAGLIPMRQWVLMRQEHFIWSV